MDQVVQRFKPEGYFDGVPYRFEADGAIEALIDGKVTRFGDFVAFVEPHTRQAPRRDRFLLPLLLLVHVAACCASMHWVQHYYSYLPFIAGPGPTAKAIINTLPMAGLVILFALGRFSFGYAVAFYFFTVLTCFSWYAPSSTFTYDTRLMTLSILASAAAFSVPAILWRPRLPRLPEIRSERLGRVVDVLMIAAALVFAVAATYHFHVVDPADIYSYRNAIEFPKAIGYAIGITTGAVLPFAFAYYVTLRRWVYAGAAVVLMLSAYPVTLTKVSLLMPAWLVFLALLAAWTRPRVATVLSLLIPIAAGLVTVIPLRHELIQSSPALSVINFRLIGVPAINLDIYSEFFAKHPLTWFCQISFLKPLTACPYGEPLAVILSNAFGFGTLNASLFATEGIASVGPVLAPLSALICGFIVALGNGLTAKLPPRFVLISSGVVLQAFLNVPMTTLLLTGGLATLFLLWMLTPTDALRR
jgi:hypothetical protein